MQIKGETIFNLKSMLVKEQVGFLKISRAYDIFDPDTQAKIAVAKEETNIALKLLKLFVNKAMLPTTVNVYQADSAAEGEKGELQFSLKRGFALLRPKLKISNAQGEFLGYLQPKMFSIGGAFKVFSPDDVEVARVKGDWKGWNFKFLVGEQEVGLVTKKWAGVGKELFTSADTYMIDIHGEVNAANTILLLSAGLCIDLVLKSSK
tara:strand:+ start:721 stop:1338 length:618 start_codon:yes stop_codon:yes gene_type:complete